MISNRHILLVDDEPNVLSGFQRTLGDRFRMDTASNGPEALAKLKKTGPYAVVVADMQMPNMSGLDLLVQIEAAAPDTVRMMLTGNADQKTAVDAVNQGHVFRFLNKPCGSEALSLALVAGLRQFALVSAERELLEETLNGTIRLMTEMLASLYPEAFGRSERVRDCAREYLQHSGLASSWEVETAALLAPIGYLTLPAELIRKLRATQPPTPAEQRLLERLPEMSAHLVGFIPRLEPVAAILRHHRKDYDGGGFPPDNVAGESIPVGARVLRLLQDLVEREATGADKGRALAAMAARPGVYDPAALDAARALFAAGHRPDASGPSAIHPKPLRDLRVGQVLAGDVTTIDGVLVAAAGVELTPMVLQRLRNFAELNPLNEPVYVRDPGRPALDDRN